MKLVPLLDKEISNDNSSKLLAIEKVNDLNLDKIRNYRKINLNCNFSNNYFDRLKKIKKCCIIIFNDYKLLLSNEKFCLKTSNFYDGYKIIFSLRKNKFIKCVMNTRSKFDILKCLFEESKFFLDECFVQNHLTNLVNILNILYYYEKEDKCSPMDKLIVERDITEIEFYIKNAIGIV